MSHEKEVAETLRAMGLSGSEIATPDLIDKARRFIYLQRQIHAAHREQERYFQRVGSFGGHAESIQERHAPPPRPVRELLAEALAKIHIPAYQNLLVRPGDLLFDFAYPVTRLAVVLEQIEVDGDTELPDDWRVILVRPETIRRSPMAAALFIKGAYLEQKKARAARKKHQQ